MGKNKLRKGIVNDDLIEAVIELPSSLYFHTKIQSFVLVNKQK